MLSLPVLVDEQVKNHPVYTTLVQLDTEPVRPYLPPILSINRNASKEPTKSKSQTLPKDDKFEMVRQNPEGEEHDDASVEGLQTNPKWWST